MGNYNNRRPTEYVYADTEVWQCSECNCWSRIEFIHASEPHCPMCNSSMALVTKNIRIE